jgi:hypothetical protein
VAIVVNSGLRVCEEKCLTLLERLSETVLKNQGILATIHWQLFRLNQNHC